MTDYPHWWDDPHAEEHGWLAEGWVIPGYEHLTTIHAVPEPSMVWLLALVLVACVLRKAR